MTSDFMALLLAGLVGGVALLVAAAMSPSLRLATVAWLAIPQFWVPGIPLTLAQGWLLVVATVAVATGAGGRRHLTAGGGAILALILSQMLAIQYSPDASDGVTLTIQLLLFGAILWHACLLGAEAPEVIDRGIGWAAPWMVFQAGLVILFRLQPDLELTFYASRIGELLVGPSAAGLFGDQLNNVLDPAKAGGLVVNGNAASMLLGVCTLTLWASFRRTGLRRHQTFAIICWVAVFATGSKSGIALAITIPVVVRLLAGLASRERRGAAILLTFITLALGVLAPFVAERAFPTYLSESSYSLATRGYFWRAAQQLFAESPVFGLGFGGWNTEVSRFVGGLAMPPHNLLVAAWANAGTLGLLATLAFVTSILVNHLRALSGVDALTHAKVIAASAGAWLWVFAHGQADNTTIYGERHTLVFLALLGGYLAYYRSLTMPSSANVQRARPQSSSDLDENASGDSRFGVRPG